MRISAIATKVSGLVLGVCLLASAAAAQSSGSVSLVLVTWVQSGSASGAAAAAVTAPTAQTVVGSFNDMTTCIDAAQKVRLSNGATALNFNFICIPLK